jgi:hypothetical protein
MKLVSMAEREHHRGLLAVKDGASRAQRTCSFAEAPPVLARFQRAKVQRKFGLTKHQPDYLFREPIAGAGPR